MAIKREEIIKNIIGMFTRFKDKVTYENAVGFYDINISSESLFMNVLNRIYGLKLKDMNAIQRNFPAIDLGDERAGVCYQITSTGTQDKYNTTVKKFKEKKLNETFRELRFLLIGDNEIKKLDTEIRTQVFDLTSIIQDVRFMPDAELAEFERYFDSQMNEGHASENILRAALLAPNGSDSFESFLTYLKVDEEYKQFAIDEIKIFLDMLRKIPSQQRQLLYFVVHDGHFPDSSRRNKGDTNNVYISFDLVYEEFSSKIQGAISSLEQRGFIEYDDDYYYQGQEYPTRAFRTCWFGKESEINFSAAVKDFLDNNADDLYDFFVNTNTSKLA